VSAFAEKGSAWVIAERAGIGLPKRLSPEGSRKPPFVR